MSSPGINHKNVFAWNTVRTPRELLVSCNSHSVSLKQPPARVERRGLEQLAPDRRVKVRVRARIRARLSSTALVSGYIIRVRVKGAGVGVGLGLPPLAPPLHDEIGLLSLLG